MRAAVTLLVFALATLALTAQAPAAPDRLDTGIVDEFRGPEASMEFRRIRQAGARYVRMILYWREVAPAQRPKGFEAADPRQRGYRWKSFDQRLKLAVAAGLRPIVGIQQAPSWAEDRKVKGKAGTRRPSIGALREFARAAADRYDGSGGMPRVRYWQVWNEPNLDAFLTPLMDGREMAAASWYRSAINGVAAAVKSVRRDNMVIAGGLSPFTIKNDFANTIPPMQFMRSLLCLSPGARPSKTCSERLRFDIWSHHPYTTGGPRHKASSRDDVSLGDLGEMRRALRAAERLGTIRSSGPVDFWVTEFSWDSAPPDPGGVPAGLHARWVSEALYRMWRADVSLVTWFTIRDHPTTSPFQSGLWYRGETIEKDRRKPALIAFRFPFVAFTRGERIDVWGRTPSSTSAGVTIQQWFRGGWRTVRTLSANTGGVFKAALTDTGSSGPVRARVGRTLSLPFSLKDPGDKRYLPFGSV